VAEEAIEGQKVIKGFGGQDYENAAFNKVTRHNRQQEMKLIVTEALGIPLVQLIGSVALAVTICLATLSPDHMLGTAISPGAFAAMMTAMISILKPIKQLTKVNSNIQRGIAGAASIFAFLDEKPEQDNGKQTFDSIQGQLSFENVSFSYFEEGKEGTRQTLENIAFEIKAGETVAIVGRSGGGKSTLVNLLPRFYDGKGEIKIDGVNIFEMNLQNLRQHIAIVNQQVTLFNDTVANNIAYGCKNPDKNRIIEAAKSAYAFDFIQQLPEGFETLIGENGVRLSGGQRQRLAIARAIFKKAPILILDEATSALDTESERFIQAALDELMTHCTTLVIAHRLSTIEKADRIIVIDEGRIVEMGTHAELAERAGIYASLRTLQYEQEPLKTA
jgi:subfamily B ATP-binding cassette protein MsbA